MRRLLVAKFSRKTAQDAVPPGGLSLESPNLTGPDLYPSGLVFWPPDSTIWTAVLLKPHVVDVSVPPWAGHYRTVFTVASEGAAFRAYVEKSFALISEPHLSSA